MFKNKMLQWLIMILIAITLIALASFVLWEYLDKKPKSTDPLDQAASSVENVKVKKMTAKEEKDNSVEMKDVLTNLSSKNYVKVSFSFLLDNSKAKEEFELLNARVRAIVLQTLADMTGEQASGSKGQDLISTTLINKINPILSKGKLVRVDITDINITNN
ncbi:flagellar basal body-associated FliL family protein [Paenibacillus ginsengarvi]|uniref:Flagellar protein FliL n=1 Tax=Paenibacillus ginsengarvi TaxID=400777 RepID=A0A3B0CSH0_9BACL|nr:flagellar basal body-associated FliL family protein [Paenibacillus ginsengarvi]RKN86514.1 flagellar basal body protein FliL [Paenibacillus ginsengarvi]